MGNVRMMRKVSGILFVVAFFLMMVTQGCSEKVDVTKYEFYYYPNVNMYYDVTAGQFIYSLDSARTWNSINEMTREQPATLGTATILHSDDREIWKQNEEHRRLYGGTIFNILTQENKYASVKEEVKERKAPVRTTKAIQEEPKKKGLAKFFKNIFGKKKKEEQQPGR